jgi:hypothetical protein
MKKAYRRVKESRWLGIEDRRGRLRANGIWFLDLECGHRELRLYPAAAKMAGKVLCHRCQESGAIETPPLP